MPIRRGIIPIQLPSLSERGQGEGHTETSLKRRTDCLKNFASARFRHRRRLLSSDLHRLAKRRAGRSHRVK